jgi:hypothetical protein
VKTSREPLRTTRRKSGSKTPVLELERSGQKIKLRALGVVAHLISVAAILGSAGYLIHQII